MEKLLKDQIRLGRAYVRMIEAADVLLQQKLEQQELLTFQAARRQAVRPLRELVRECASGHSANSGREQQRAGLVDGWDIKLA
jgi:hypothetical protein